VWSSSVLKCSKMVCPLRLGNEIFIVHSKSFHALARRGMETFRVEIEIVEE
jgi:hypothetical protein